MAKQATMDINAETIEIAAFFKKLREDFSTGTTTREAADTLANIAGKQLRAVQINFGNQVYQQNMDRQRRGLPPAQPALPGDPASGAKDITPENPAPH